MSQDDEFGRLPMGSYDGVVFAVIGVPELHTGSRAAFHRFPHKPGQRVEYVGREPVSGVIQIAMFPSLRHEKLANHVLWPDGIELLRERVQAQRSYELVVPPFGVLKRAFVKMTESYGPTTRNGCFATLAFTEDSTDIIAKGKLANVRGSIRATASGLDNELGLLKLKMAQAIEDARSGASYTDFATAIGAFLALGDQAEQSIANRVAMATRISDALGNLFDRAASTFNDPVNWKVREALLDLKLGVADALDESIAAARPIAIYTTVADTSAAAIASVTGNAVADILALNPLLNANDIAGDSQIFIYDDAA